MSEKVIFIIGKLSSGGAERVVSNISLSLPWYINREIILFGHDGKIDYNYKGHITYLDKDNPNNFLAKIITLINRLIKLRRIKSQNSNATIISFTEYPNLLNLLTGNLLKTIISVRSFMSIKHKKGLKSFFWNMTVKHLYKKANNIIVVSKQMRNDLIANYGLNEDNIKVIYNSYPLKYIENASEEKLTNHEHYIFNNPVIITSGRFIKSKGHHHLLRAFKKVKRIKPQVMLVFLGEGKLREQLREQARELQIEENIHFLGFQNNPFKYIARSKVFVMTSYYEGFPNALAEAMACKIPVISTDCPSGPREILAPYEFDKKITYDDNKDRYGILVPNINSQNSSQVETIIAEKIIDLVINKEKQMFYAEKSYQRIKEFDINNVIKEWIEII